MSSKLEALNRWVDEVARLTQPDAVHWCDGSDEENRHLIEKMERDGTLIAASFTHADLAHMTGVTRQSDTVSIKRFTELGILHAHGANLVISNAGLLSEIRDGKLAKAAASDDA